MNSNPKTPSPEDRHLFLAFSTFTGEPSRFEAWYDTEHIPQILSAPRMMRAQRFEPADVKPLPGIVTPDLGHLALYELDGDLEGFRQEVKRMLTSGEMQIPDFMIPPFGTMMMRPVSSYFEARQ